MCGIAGIFSPSSDPGLAPCHEELVRAAAVLRHRGPDGWGTFIDRRCGLAHTRLSLLDLPTGAQPLTNEDATVWVSFNGEIYNHAELRRELERTGHVFATRSDTEVIVHAYEEWGDQTWERLRGQFAIALYDSRYGQLRLARDRVGIAPIHVAEVGGVWIFASEAKAIFATGRVRPELDPAGLAAAISLWAPPAPRTVFAGVRTVPPGSVLGVDAAGRETVRAYWQPSILPRADLSTADASKALGEHLRAAVSTRLRADVPVGCYVSGGLDSSVIAALAARSESSPIETFSIRFDDARFDEGPAQRRIAEMLGTRHHEMLIAPKDLHDSLSRTIRHVEAPLTRLGPVPMHLLSGLVRERGIKAVLTGEGADEFFSGYDLFKEAKIRRFWSRQPGSDARAALLSRIHPYIRGQSPGPWQDFFRQGLSETDDPYYSHRPRWRNGSWVARFLHPDLRIHAERSSLDAMIAAALPGLSTETGVLDRAVMIELATFHSPYLLAAQGDRVSLGNGVEARYPFLDERVMDFGLGLEPRHRLCGLRDKVVVRDFARTILPEEICRRPKFPFRAPIASSLFGSAPGGPSEFVRERLDPAAIRLSGVFDPGPASALAARALSSATLTEREEMAATAILTTQILVEELLQDEPDRTRTACAALNNAPPDVRADQRAA